VSSANAPRSNSTPAAVLMKVFVIDQSRWTS
jgi:hypothetical protein